jgi:arylsulfatase A-like enzyme
MDIQKKLLMRMSALGLAIAATVNLSLPVMAAKENGMLQDTVNSNASQGEKVKTNIAYIVLDDMGFSDFGCYGSEIKTPNIDKLAANGLSYNNFTVCPVCSPTRASLLTGRDNHTVGMGHVSRVDLGVTVPDTRGRITNKAATVAQVLKSNSFTTLALGKWHCAPLHQVTAAGPYENWPLAKGFDRYYGFLDGETDQYDPQLTYDNHQIELPRQKGYQVSADLVDKAKMFVTDTVSIAPERPFFVYLAFGAVHAPHQAPEKYINMYNGVYDKGWDKIREERFKRQKKLGIIPADAKLTPRDNRVQQWKALSPEEKKVFARFMQTYAGFLTYADAQIGRFVDHLKAIGQFDNTMIVLLSDNGATDAGRDVGSDYLAAGSVMGSYGPEFVKKYYKLIHEIGGPEVEALYQRGWGMVSNTPFQGYKGTTFAGGTRVPLIIHWSEGIKAKGEVRTQPVYVTDITPTVLDILKINAPNTFQGIDQLPMDGVSIVDTFSDANAPAKHNVHYDLLHSVASLIAGTGNRSITKDGWKAVYSAGNQEGGGKARKAYKWELFNLNEDYSESYDLAEQFPEKLNELKNLWTIEAKKHGAVIQGKPGPTDAINNGNVFKFYPGTGFLGKGATPNLYNKSYTITVPIYRKQKSQEGVLAANGDRFSGYTFYVKNNRLVYELNDWGVEVKRIVSNKEIPTGDAVLKFEFDKAEKGKGGIGRIYINGAMVGEVKITRVSQMFSMEGLSIGRDMYSPVSPAYQDKGEFPFAGKYDYVLFELKNDQ